MDDTTGLMSEPMPLYATPVLRFGQDTIDNVPFAFSGYRGDSVCVFIGLGVVRVKLSFLYIDILFYLHGGQMTW